MNSLAGAISELETADRGNHTKYTLTNTLPTIRTSPKCVIMSKAPSMATHAVVQFLPFTSRSGRAFRPPAPASPHSAKLSVSQRNGGGWQRMRMGMSTRARAKAEKPGRTNPAKPAAKAAKVPEQVLSEKAARAKLAHKLVNKDIQRYAEEYNEPRFAKVVQGISHPDSEPMDVTTKSGDPCELKTLVDNSNSKITMDSYSQVRKIVKESETGKTFHTIVSDDQSIYNAKGEGKHGDDSKRKYYYRRGVAGSARIGSLYECKDEAELLKMMSLPEKELPEAAARTDGKLRVGKWKFFQDETGKGYQNTKTGQVFRAKK